jgi:hypothetical protein
VVLAALQALVAFLRKTHHANIRWSGFPELNARLLKLCQGWGGREEVRVLQLLGPAFNPR